MNHNLRTSNQVINVDGKASQIVLTINFDRAVNEEQISTSKEIPKKKLLLRVREAAELLSLSRTNLYKLLVSGELESLKIGRSRLISVDSLHAFIERCKAESSAPKITPSNDF